MVRGRTLQVDEYVSATRRELVANQSRVLTLLDESDGFLAWKLLLNVPTCSGPLISHSSSMAHSLSSCSSELPSTLFEITRRWGQQHAGKLAYLLSLHECLGDRHVYQNLREDSV